MWTEPRMPCSISDGEQFEDDAIPGLDDLEDEDIAFERTRQYEIDDDLHNTLKEIGRWAA